MWEGKVQSTYVREWVSEDCKANLVIIHGVGEHSGRYIETAENLHQAGFNIYTGDLVGHGLSDGPRIYIKSIEDYLKDVEFFIGRIKNDRPVFLLGHSMGGLIVLYYMLIRRDERIKGVIASSPYIQDKIKIHTLKYIIGKTAAALCPRLKIESGLKGEMVCRDKEIAQQYNNDVLNCSKVTAKWFLELEKARFKLVSDQKDFTSLCLILQAGADIVVDADGVQQFYQEISSVNKEFVLYDEFYHEILNDPKRSMVIDKILEWLNKRI